jgi:hypothetical protein
MHALGIRGRQGRLKVGHRTAATLGAFSLSPVPSGWAVEAEIASTDAFWIAQSAARSLDLDVGKQRWIWRDVTLEVDGGTVRGTVLGRPDRR